MQQESIVLVLQGGGALGAYQAGAYDALSEAGLAPNWVAGISIGAINAAIIAGNMPEQRGARLKQFWETVSSGLQVKSGLPGNTGRSWFNEMSSWMTTLYGVPGFFKPRFPSPVLAAPGSEASLSYYDTAPLFQTLNALVDFDILNNGTVRASVGAVHIKSGNFRYFDTQKEKLSAEHIVASGALPPGLPPVKIDGEYYWDGGLVSNTPLQYVLDQPSMNGPLCIFQVDLFPAQAAMPKNIFEVGEREKEIRFSSRTRLNTHIVQENQRIREIAKRLIDKLPPEWQSDADVQELLKHAPQPANTLVHLIKRPTDHDSQSKDFEFSRISVEENWAAGARDVKRSLNSTAWKNRKREAGLMATLDLTRNGSI